MAVAKTTRGRKPTSQKAAGKTTNLKEIDKTINELVELFETLQPKD